MAKTFKLHPQTPWQGLGLCMDPIHSGQKYNTAFREVCDLSSILRANYSQLLTFPSSKTRILSESNTVCSLCAIVSNVQSLKASRIVVWTKLSVSVSIAAVASSNIKICKERSDFLEILQSLQLFLIISVQSYLWCNWTKSVWCWA